jgi:enoyl-CoA hydratase/carnithine racemase
MNTQDLTIHRQADIIHLEITRPAKRNALTVAMYAALADGLADANASDDIRTVILSGAGENFCAGNDLMDFVANPPDGPDAAVFRFLHALATMRKILVAAVQGQAIGIGTTMLLHCDFVFLEPDAKLKMPFVDLALVPEAGSSLLVPNLIGYRRAAELLLLGDSVDAARAVALGLANSVVAAGEALPAARALAARLAQKPAGALLATKALMRSETRDVLGRMDEENRSFSERLQTPEVRAVVESFFRARAKPGPS